MSRKKGKPRAKKSFCGVSGHSREDVEQAQCTGDKEGLPPHILIRAKNGVTHRRFGKDIEPS